MEHYKTLADTVKVYDNLPRYLQFSPESIMFKMDKESMFEDMYVESRYLSKLKEAKGTRKLMAPYFANTPEEDISWYDFLSKNAEGIKEINITKSDFNRELAIYKKDPNAYGGKYVGRSNDEDEEDDEDSPEMDLDDPEISPTLKTFYKVANAAKNATESVQESVDRKYKRLYNTARNVASSLSLNSFAFLGGSPGIGKSYGVRVGVEDGLKEWKSNARHKNKPKVDMVSGSIGNSLSDLVTYFYKKRHEYLIVLDDCDSFFLSTDMAIQNFLKRLLDPDYSTITIPQEIKKRANKNLADEAELIAANQEKNLKKESRHISLDMTHLKEGSCSVSVDGYKIDFKPDSSDIKKLKETFKFSESGSDDIINKAKQETEILDTDVDISLLETPQFEFDSNIIIISNLDIDDMNEAVISRCDQFEIHLTIPEYFCRLEQILPTLKMGVYSSMNRDVIEWAKREAFAIFKIMVLEGRKYKGLNFNITVRFDFRLMTKITNIMIILINDYCLANNVDPVDVSTRPQIEAAIEEEFIHELLGLLTMPTKKRK